MQSLIDDTKRKLNPASADTNDLRGFEYMGSGFSKIYSALVPGIPIYDSRVACAFTCLVRLHCNEMGRSSVPPLLTLGVPPSRVSGISDRCQSPAIHASQTAKYAEANLKAAWLFGKMVEQPGDFAGVSASHRVDALQSALFMVGYCRLGDEAITELR